MPSAHRAFRVHMLSQVIWVRFWTQRGERSWSKANTLHCMELSSTNYLFTSLLGLLVGLKHLASTVVSKAIHPRNVTGSKFGAEGVGWCLCPRLQRWPNLHRECGFAAAMTQAMESKAEQVAGQCIAFVMARQCPSHHRYAPRQLPVLRLCTAGW